MPTKQANKADQVREQLEVARETEQKLLEEMADLPNRLQRAAAESAQEFQEAAASGQDLKEGKDLADARQRAQELPSLVWSASLHTQELAASYHELRAEEAKSEQYRASEEAAKLEKKREDLLTPIRDLQDQMFYADNENKDHRQWARQAREHHAALKNRGPDFHLSHQVLSGRS